MAKRVAKPSGYWSIKENVFQESHNYNSRVDFCEGCYNAYIKAKKMDGLTKCIGYQNLPIKKKDIGT